MNDSCKDDDTDCIWRQGITLVIHLPRNKDLLPFSSKFTFITFQEQTKTSLSSSVNTTLFSSPFKKHAMQVIILTSID